jgi:Fe-S-cluster-containing dehydrogenase component
MNIERRDFFKVVSAGVAAASTTKPAQAEVRKSIQPDAPAILYDATLCIGCKSCEVGCKTINNIPKEHGEVEEKFGVAGVWDSGGDLSQSTLNKIKLYKDGTAAVKDREKDGYSFIKRACMHCADPDCVSACPVTALTKDEKTGIVKWNKDNCIGCRYCQVACPYNIPKFEYDKAIPEIVKCEMCYQELEKGGIPGCCSYCPTGASLFGTYAELLEEAHRRLNQKAGATYDYPINKIGSQKHNSRPVAQYVASVYGEKEGGGTQYILLSAVPFEKLGLPSLPDYSSASKSEGLQHTLYKGLIAPAVLLGGLLFAAHNGTKNNETKGGGK